MHLWRRSHKTVVVHWTSDFFCNYCVCKRRQLRKPSSNDVYNDESRITMVEMPIWRYFLRTLSWSARHLRARESFNFFHSVTLCPATVCLRLGVALIALPPAVVHVIPVALPRRRIVTSFPLPPLFSTTINLPSLYECLIFRNNSSCITCA